MQKKLYEMGRVVPRMDFYGQCSFIAGRINFNRPPRKCNMNRCIVLLTITMVFFSRNNGEEHGWSGAGPPFG